MLALTVMTSRTTTDKLKLMDTTQILKAEIIVGCALHNTVMLELCLESCMHATSHLTAMQLEAITAMTSSTIA